MNPEAMPCTCCNRASADVKPMALGNRITESSWRPRKRASEKTRLWHLWNYRWCKANPLRVPKTIAFPIGNISITLYEWLIVTNNLDDFGVPPCSKLVPYSFSPLPLVRWQMRHGALCGASVTGHLESYKRRVELQVCNKKWAWHGLSM